MSKKKSNTARLRLGKGRPSAIGENVRKFREAQGLSQGELARRAGVSQQGISYLESGRNRKSMNLDKIALVLGVPFGALYGRERDLAGTPEPPSPPELKEVAIPITYRKVPFRGIAEVDKRGVWTKERRPEVGNGRGTAVEVPSTDYRAYVLCIEGTALAPSIKDGWGVLIEPGRPVSRGDYVVVALTNGGKTIRELLWREKGDTKLGHLGGEGRPIVLAAKDTKSLEYVAAILPPSRIALLDEPVSH